VISTDKGLFKIRLTYPLSNLLNLAAYKSAGCHLRRLFILVPKEVIFAPFWCAIEVANIRVCY